MQTIYLSFYLCGILFCAISIIYLNNSKPANMLTMLNFVGVSVFMSLCGGIITIFEHDFAAEQIGYKIISVSLILYIVSLSSFLMRYNLLKTPRVIKIVYVFYASVFGGIILFSILKEIYTVYRANADGDFACMCCFYFGLIRYIQTGVEIILCILNFYIIYLHNKKNDEIAKGSVSVAKINLLIVFALVCEPVLVYFGVTLLPIFMLISWIIILIRVYRYRMFDSMQMAKDDIIETIKDGFVVIDIADNLLFVNKIAQSIFQELKYEATQPIIIDKLKHAAGTELHIGNNYYQISTVPFYDRYAYKGTTIWINDVTEEHISREKLIELKEEAEKANQAKSVFLANMSHEIRTPMNAIIGMSEMILNDNINSFVEENAKNIRSAGNSLLSIINGILDFSKIENGKMEDQETDYNIGFLVKDICNIINLKLKDKNVELIVHMKDTMPALIRGDETHVRQIFTNLLTNAVKYTKRGYIRMNIDWEKIQDHSDTFVIIKASVEDTGCGIKEENLDSLFDSFQRVDMIKNRTIEGTGLGLAICKKLVESMEGQISVKSSYGVGSLFSFTIKQKLQDETPLGSYDALVLPGDITPEKTFIAPLAKVLVVDDNVTNLKVAQGILTMYKVRVDTALSGAECIEKIQNNNYHLILMDQMMPEMDGIQTTKLIRISSDPHIRNMIIIAVTANAISGTREMFLQNGFQEYISKPITISSVESILKKFLPPEIIIYVDKSMDETDYSDVRISIPYVDVEQGLANYGNDKGKYLQILKFIYDDGQMHLQRIRDYLEGEHYKEYVYEVHSLKGLMAGIGANQLAEFARLQEFAGRDGNINIIQRESHFVIEQYAAMLENIKNVLEDSGMLREEIEQFREEELTWKEFSDMLHSLQGSLDLLEQGEAARKADNLLTYPLDAGIRKQLIEIKHAINEFEYDEASEYIRQLLM